MTQPTNLQISLILWFPSLLRLCAALQGGVRGGCHDSESLFVYFSHPTVSSVCYAQLAKEGIPDNRGCLDVFSSHVSGLSKTAIIEFQLDQVVKSPLLGKEGIKGWLNNNQYLT